MNLFKNRSKQQKLDFFQKQIDEGNQSVETLKVEIAGLLKQVQDPVLVDLFNKILNYSCSLFALQNLANGRDYLEKQ